jgi:hypothetical protein
LVSIVNENIFTTELSIFVSCFNLFFMSEKLKNEKCDIIFFVLAPFLLDGEFFNSH